MYLFLGWINLFESSWFNWIFNYKIIFFIVGRMKMGFGNLVSN